MKLSTLAQLRGQVQLRGQPHPEGSHNVEDAGRWQLRLAGACLAACKPREGVKKGRKTRDLSSFASICASFIPCQLKTNYYMTTNIASSNRASHNSSTSHTPNRDRLSTSIHQSSASSKRDTMCGRTRHVWVCPCENFIVAADSCPRGKAEDRISGHLVSTTVNAVFQYCNAWFTNQPWEIVFSTHITPDMVCPWFYWQNETETRAMCTDCLRAQCRNFDTGKINGSTGKK